MKTCPQCQIKYPDVLEFCPRDGTALPSDGAKDPEYDPILDTTIDGRYAIESRLGEGGMGVVYKARHVLIDKPVAIKILRKEAAQDTAAVQRFIQEAKSASKINHSNIVDITDFGVLADGHAYFVMEFLQGQTLAQAIHEGPLEPSRVCNIGAQVARGLHAAHTKNIIHRDLKPENIFLLEREGQKDFVKIVDFGIAKVGSGQKLTQVGMVLGTPEYMSPEQATGQETDHRVDQYALGCIMYEMLTGAVPFLGDRPAQTLTKHVFEQPTPLRKKKPEANIPATLESVVLRTLAKKPEQRFPSMRELEQALMQVENEQKGGRVVIDDSRMLAASAMPSAPNAVPTPAPSQYSGAVPSNYPQQQAQPAQQQGYPAQQQAFYPSGPAGAPAQPNVGYAQPANPYSAMQSAGIAMAGATQTAGRARSLRTVLAAVTGALLVIIILLIYFVTKKDPPPPPLPPRTNPTTKPPPKVDLMPPKVVLPPPKVELPPITLNVSSRPIDAEVYIDGNFVGKTPYTVTHKRGVTVRIEVRKRGFDPYYEEMQPDSDQNLDIKLEKPTSGKPQKPTKPVKGVPGKPNQPGTTSPLPTGLRDPFKKGGGK